jgi:glycosyltransferase involved in cell wall biosynthesis/GT2 family glycosyltransferase
VVLFTSYSGALGGAERLMIEWAGALGKDVCIACPEGQLALLARQRGLRVFPLTEHSLDRRASLRDRALAVRRLRTHARELRALVDGLEPELLIAWGMRSAIAWFLLGPRPGGPPVVFHHNDFLPGRAIGRAVRAAATRADLVTVPSRAVAEDLDPSGRLGDRVVVVHPGVDPDRFDPAVAPGRLLEIAVLGALVPWKRPDLALEVAALARRRLPQVRLRLIGAPLEGAADRVSAALRARAAEPDLAGAVEFAGSVADVAPELARASCVLHCAEREPFGLAVLEALAAGRPAVVPAAGGPAEIVDDSCAIEYPPGDAAVAADAVVRVVSDPELAARMGAAGRVRARAQFDAAQSRASWAEAVGRVRSGAHGTSPGPSFEIVTVTHNSEGVIGGLLESVERHLPGVRVLIVDCASSDGTLAAARRSPVARLIALDQNVGFGRASNRGVAEVEAAVTALLNPDVELLDGSLLALAAEAVRRAAPERLLAPLVFGGDGSRQDSVQPAPGSAGSLAGSLLPFTRLTARVAAPMAPWRASSPRRVGWAVGCALLARTETLRRLGPFDERIFLYGEDLELGLRADDAGIETWFWPAARVLHHGAHATSAAFGEEPAELLARARRAAIALRRGRGVVALDDAAQALTFASRIIGKRVLGRPAARERRQLAALRRARREGR